MPLQPHQVLDYIQSGKVFTVKPRPVREDQQYLDIMSAWYQEVQKDLPCIECFDILIALDKLRKTDWAHVSESTELLITVAAYRLPYRQVWLSYPDVAYLLSEEYDPTGEFYIRAQAFIKEDTGLAVSGATVRLYPTADLSKRPNTVRRPGGLSPMPEDQEGNVGLHAEVDILYETKELSDQEIQTIERLAALHVSVFLVMLNTRGVPKERCEAPVRLNRARAKKKRAPILTVTRVSLPKGMLEKREKAEGATRCSPRLHWRRGHLTTRHRETGQWIKPCVVGLPQRGMVGRKSYEVGTQVPVRYETDLINVNFAPRDHVMPEVIPGVIDETASVSESPKELEHD